jgi:Transcriptional regulators
MELDNILDLVLDNLQKLFFPEKWIRLDLTVSKTELLAMLIVYRYGEVIMSEIADYINAPLSTTTGLVNRLVTNGYMLRERSEGDRRIVAIRLTEKGKNLVKEVREGIEYYIGRINTVLSNEERQTLLDVFFKILNVLSREDEGPVNGPSVQDIRKIPID